MACLKCNAKRIAIAITLMILIAVGCGLIIWQYLPKSSKSALAGAAADRSIPISTWKGNAPPPTYVFSHCLNQSNCCNGIEGLCDLRVNDIFFAGVHNGQATVEDGFHVAPNHDYSSISSMDYGFRNINVDLGVCNGALALVHGHCKLGTIDPSVFFGRMQQWLDIHPTDVLLVPIQVDNSAGTAGTFVDIGEFWNLLNAVEGFTNRMYQKINGLPWPTLREMVDTDKRIIMFYYDGVHKCSDSNFTCPPGIHDYFASVGETQFQFTTANDIENITYACQITRGRLYGPFFAINDFPEIPSKDFSKSLLNTKAFLTNHIQACSGLNGGLTVNSVYVDWWSEGDLPQVTQIHNSLLANQGRRRS